MKRFTKHLLLLALGAMYLVPTQAQLINQFKKEDAHLKYLQFPMQKERISTMKVELIEENMLGNVAEKVIKNDKITGALTGKGGLLADDSEVSGTKRLIPTAFPSQGELYVEVNLSQEFKGKKTMNIEKKFHEFVKNGEKVEALVSYTVYSMPGKKVLYKQDPVWVQSYVVNNNTVSGSGTSGSRAGAMKAPLDGNQLESARKKIAKSWATEQVRDNYGLRYKSIPTPVYMIKGLEKEEKKQAEAIMEKFAGLVGTFTSKGKTEEFASSVNECITYWQTQLKQYKPGTKKKKEALINDANAWCLYYNISVANLMLGNEKISKTNLNKALALRELKVKDIVNKKGEKVGEKSGMNNPQEQSTLKELKEAHADYFAGIKANNPIFVDMLTDLSKKKKAGRFAREYSANLFLTQVMGVDAPVSFVSCNTSESPKSLTGKVSYADNNISYSVKKNILFFIMPKYIGKVANADNSARTKQKFSDIMLPLNYSTSFNLPVDISHYKVKTMPKASWAVSSKVQYDYNGDILITNNMIKDKWAFFTFCKITDADALAVKRANYRIAHNNFEVNAIDEEFQVIERSRDMGFFSAWAEKLMSDKPLKTTDTKNESTKAKVTMNGKMLKIKNGKSSAVLDMAVNKDDKGNWTEIKLGENTIQRTVVY